MAPNRVLSLLVLVMSACAHQDLSEAPSPMEDKKDGDAPPRKGEVGRSEADTKGTPVSSPASTTSSAPNDLPAADEGAASVAGPSVVLGKLAAEPEAQAAAPPRGLLATVGTRGAGDGGGGLGGYGDFSGVPAPPVADTESYDGVTDNRFEAVRSEPLSTFSIDVDTASYSNTRRFLQEGSLPPRDAVRVEELINYFDYDYPGPSGDHPFTVITEVASCPWQPEHRLVHIGLQGKRLDEANIPPRNLVFLVDVSGSMEGADRLPLVRAGLRDLTSRLRVEDHVSIVVYAGSSGLVLPPTSGADKLTILTALDRLSAGGSTAGGEGIELAYQVAQQHFQDGAVNRVILATDGDFNVGMTGEGDLVRLIEQKREGGVFLTVLGFGRGNLKDSMMEKLADHGNGHYAYIDSLDEAKKTLGDEAGASLVTIAKDVKIQVEWNPALVAGYRLVGYENRLLAAQDFHDDKKDAGEIGAGHSVTALYEVIPAGQELPGSPIDNLKYQQVRPAPGAASAEMLTVKLRYKAPSATTSQLLSFPLQDSGKAWRAASADFRFSAGLASFGMLLRDSADKGQSSWTLVEELARGAQGRDPRGERREFRSLIERASELSGLRVGGGTSPSIRVVR